MPQTRDPISRTPRRHAPQMIGAHVPRKITNRRRRGDTYATVNAGFATFTNRKPGRGHLVPQWDKPTP
ncbi:MAG: hypothetical protein HZA93_24065 [Verrucomicrobia bacterium]|nr:hypothetical protein [Verrucomicrobiota bacterium]